MTAPDLGTTQRMLATCSDRQLLEHIFERLEAGAERMAVQDYRLDAAARREDIRDELIRQMTETLDRQAAEARENAELLRHIRSGVDWAVLTWRVANTGTRGKRIVTLLAAIAAGIWAAADSSCAGATSSRPCIDCCTDPGQT